MKKNILVIGGGGYVGSSLVPALIRDGYNVTVYDLFLYGNYLPDHNNLKILKGDVRNLVLLKKALLNIDSVIHLACISNDPSFELKPELARSINYDFFEPLVKLSSDIGISKFIFASSSSVYGIKKDKNVIEESELKPLTDYSKYKVLCEEILLKYKTEHFCPVILRPSTVNGYSPRLRLDVVVNIMTNLAYHTGKIKVFGGDQLRPNIFMQDMVRAYINVLKSPNHIVSGNAYNVGDENISVKEISETVKNIIAKNIQIEVSKTDDIRSYHISSRKIKKELGFDLKYNIKDGIKSLIDKFDKNFFTDTLNDDRYYNLRVLNKSNFF